MKNLDSYKYKIKIPNNVQILYVPEKRILICKNVEKTKIIKLKLKLKISKKENTIFVTQDSFSDKSFNQKKKTKALQGTATAEIKRAITELLYTFYRKLNLVGVGYRVTETENFENKLLTLKLGYSHSLFFKINETAKMSPLKLTKLFIYGNSYNNITQVASFIRSHKKPEPYKGKGILYEKEKITLKEGKKV